MDKVAGILLVLLIVVIMSQEILFDKLAPEIHKHEEKAKTEMHL